MKKFLFALLLIAGQAFGAGTVLKTIGDTQAAYYSCADWTPTANGSVTSYPTSCAFSATTSWVSVSAVSSGSMTFTFPQTGTYEFTGCMYHWHSGAYTSFGNVMTLTGGTATRQTANSSILFGLSLGANTNNMDAGGCWTWFVKATAANQTQNINFQSQSSYSTGYTTGHSVAHLLIKVISTP